MSVSDIKKVSKNPMFNIGDIVKHRIYPFRGVIVDVDPEFDNTDEFTKYIMNQGIKFENEVYKIFKSKFNSISTYCRKHA